MLLWKSVLLRRLSVDTSARCSGEPLSLRCSKGYLVSNNQRVRQSQNAVSRVRREPLSSSSRHRERKKVSLFSPLEKSDSKDHGNDSDATREYAQPGRIIGDLRVDMITVVSAVPLTPTIIAALHVHKRSIRSFNAKVLSQSLFILSHPS